MAMSRSIDTPHDITEEARGEEEDDDDVIFIKRQKIDPVISSNSSLNKTCLPVYETTTINITNSSLFVAPGLGIQSKVIPPSAQISPPTANTSLNSKIIPKLHFECFVCGMELHQLDDQSKELHLNQCLDKFEQNSEGIRSENYGCMLCGLSLRGKALVTRCQHIKRCSKIYGIGIRELLHMIAPEKYEEILTQMDNSLSQTQEVVEAKKPNAHDILMANARAKWNPPPLVSSNSTPVPQSRRQNRSSMTRASSEPKRGRDNVSSEAKVDYAPEYKKVFFSPMTTPIIVDGFTYASPTLSDCYILTHFHSDHYAGLTRSFEYGEVKSLLLF